MRPPERAQVLLIWLVLQERRLAPWRQGLLSQHLTALEKRPGTIRAKTLPPQSQALRSACRGMRWAAWLLSPLFFRR